MSFWYDLLFLLGAAIGLVGILIPMLPGTLLVLGVAIGWAVVVNETTGWVVLGVVVALLGAGLLLKYAVPGRHLQRSGVPNSTLLLGGVAGIVGFFVVPVVGLPLGFVLGVYLAEMRRVGETAARGSTWTAVKAVGLSLLIELTAGLLATVVLLVGAVLT